ncbi:MAG: hypothetical protein GEV03_19080 [Streptosporangiales bacterium]|nr:hypothetical protein [Streptosporangiales bacterium]
MRTPASRAPRHRPQGNGRVASDSPHLRLPRGHHDVPPERARHHRALREAWFDHGQLHGFQPVEIPPVGFESTFTTGHHAAGQKLYAFPDRRGRQLALVSDSLPTILRLANQDGPGSNRLSYCCPVFRYERRPRRHFHHLGVAEINAGIHTLTEATNATLRLLQLVADYLAPLLDCTVTITNPGLWRTVAARCVGPAEAPAFLDQLRRTPPRQRPRWLHARGAEPAVAQLAEHLAHQPGSPPRAEPPDPAARLDAELAEHITACHTVAAAVDTPRMSASVALGDLHAVEFHDSLAFQIRPRNQQRLLGDGGSYAAFASRFLSRPTTTYSAMVGLERLADLIPQPDPRPPATVALLATGPPEAQRLAMTLARDLRAAHIAVWHATLAPPLSRQLRELASHGIPYVLVIGPRELVCDTFRIRDATGQLTDVPRHQLISWLQQASADTLTA